MRGWRRTYLKWASSSCVSRCRSACPPASSDAPPAATPPTRPLDARLTVLRRMLRRWLSGIMADCDAGVAAHVPQMGIQQLCESVPFSLPAGLQRRTAGSDATHTSTGCPFDGVAAHVAPLV